MPVTVLDDIIRASTDSKVQVSDLLRMVQVAAYRLKATEVIEWVRKELTGYADDDPLPDYRQLGTNVMGTFAGPMQQFRELALTMRPNSLAKWWTVDLRHPVLELQAFAEGNNDPSVEWPAKVVAEYEASGVFHLEFFGLFTARNVISRPSLRGVLDVIRSKALEFALELQSTDPEAGSLGGPTVETEPQLAKIVYNNFTNNVYGDGANIAAGSHIEQRSKVVKGDRQAFKTEAERAGLSSEDAEEFVALVVEEQSVEKPKVKSYLEKVGSGAVTVTKGVATGILSTVLLGLAKAYLGL